MTQSTKILSIGRDRQLMASRSLVLRHAGYTVQEVYTSRQAVELARSDLVDLILICHTLSDLERHLLIARIRTQRRPVPILCLRDSDYSTGSVDGCKLVSSAPAELVAAVGSAVNGFSGLHG